MKNICGVISLLHQDSRPGSVMRRFRGQEVLSWTLRRMGMVGELSNTALLCWEDQLPMLQPLAMATGALVLAKGPRVPLPAVQAISAARRWSDGWRGGLLGTCHFDLGFHAPFVNEIRRKLSCDGLMLVDPDAGLVDPELLGGLIAHARSHPAVGYCFTSAAAGLAGVLIRPVLLDYLLATQGHPGRLLSYWPNLPGRDPVTRDEHVACPTPVARTPHRFTLDSQRQISLIEKCTGPLNGTLVSSNARTLVERMVGQVSANPMPRDVVLELNTRRATNPLYWPGRRLGIVREELSLLCARRLFSQLAAVDDVRLTLAGVGDPLLADGVFDIIDLARQAGISAIHVQTDMLPQTCDVIRRLAESAVDIVSVHLPSLAAATYQSIMGVDAFATVVANLEKFLTYRQQLGKGTPILVPMFAKCQQNLAEMEAWYDHWLAAVGCAVVFSPADYAGQIPDITVADMSPPGRVACRRLNTRMTVLCDGRIVACEQDVAGRHCLGRVEHPSLAETWSNGYGDLRQRHGRGEWNGHELCGGCREWHRP